MVDLGGMMIELHKTTVGEITENLDNIRVPLSKKQRSIIEKVYPYYGAQGIIDYVDGYLFDGQYLLVAEDGENLKSQNSHICNIVDGKFWVNNHAHIIRGRKDNNTEYLYYLLNLVNYRNYVTGSAQPKLTKDNLNSIQVYTHPPSVQTKIATVLSTLDKKIALNNHINTELEAMAKTLYDYWFVQFDFPISEAQANALGKLEFKGKPYKSSGGKMVFNEALKREIPEGWDGASILAVANLLGGGTPTKKNSEYWSGHIPFFTPTDADGTIFKFSTESYITDEGLKNSSTQLFLENTVLITARGSVGKLVLAGEKMAMNQSCYALQAKEGISYAYLYFLTEELIYFLKVKASGSVFNSIVSNDIKLTNLSIPKQELVEDFAEIIEPMFETISINTQENQQLTKLRDWLLPMLMNGQVTVK